jgi:hypothetical protein
MTKRILSERINEHATTSTACGQHASTTGHKMDYENVEVLDSASNVLKLRVKELLHILIKNPDLNKQLNSQSKYEIKTLIVQAYPQFKET